MLIRIGNISLNINAVCAIQGSTVFLKRRGALHVTEEQKQELIEALQGGGKRVFDITFDNSFE